MDRTVFALSAAAAMASLAAMSVFAGGMALYFACVRLGASPALAAFILALVSAGAIAGFVALSRRRPPKREEALIEREVESDHGEIEPIALIAGFVRERPLVALAAAAVAAIVAARQPEMLRQAAALLTRQNPIRR